MEDRFPYPGLRSFRRDEADVFFGRESQVDQLLEKLQESRFLAVIGPSGCGKSSLTRAGMLAALETGFMVEAGSRWHTVEMKPGERPIARLAEALMGSTALSTARSDPTGALFLEATLRRGPAGLIEAMRETPLPQNANLLLLVDQFEEIFRYPGEDSRDEADAFVALLLNAVAEREVPVYVVLTMRSDFLGDCAIFSGLPEAMNRGLYVTPRLTREQCRAAIVGPARVFGGSVHPALANRLLNDMGTDPDHLPLMQHALMRMWTRARPEIPSEALDREPAAVPGGEQGRHLTEDDYDAVGGIRDALSRHADAAYEELDAEGQRVAEVLFRCLTDRSDRRRDIRRPVPVSAVADVAGTPPEAVREVVEVFRRPDRSFVTPLAGEPILPGTVLDISHESLIRRWERLNGWVEKEASARDTYRNLERTALLWKEGKTALWGTPDLENALAWRERAKPEPKWAERYGRAFDLAMVFLDASARRTRRKRTTRLVIGAVALALTIAAVTFGVSRINENSRRASESRIAREEGLRNWNAFLELTREYGNFKGRLDTLMARQADKDKLPYWRRQDLLSAWERKEEISKERAQDLARALLLLRKAIDTAPKESEEQALASRSLEETYYSLYQTTATEGPILLDSEYFRLSAQALEVGTYSKELGGRGTVSLASDPAGAEVYCFRVERREARFIPLPFRPGKPGEDTAEGLVGRPILVVERTWDEEASPLKRGDRLLQVNGKAVETLTDLASCLESAGVDQQVEARVLRGGSEVTLAWIPFRRGVQGPDGGFRAGEMIDTREQFGLTFEGYPLECIDPCRAGRTPEGGSLELDLPRGSYVFVLVKPGFERTILPMVVEGKESPPAKVSLFRPEEMPPGFVYIPAGLSRLGGDGEAFDALESGSVPVGGFFMSRLELTVREWLEFLNDPEVQGRSDEEGNVTPLDQGVTLFLERLRAKVRAPERIALIPGGANKGERLWIKKDEKWASPLKPDYPVFNVSQLAAREYCRWRTTREGGRWSYRIPTDQEWERAARGADGRYFVWGDELLVWSFCRSLKGSGRLGAVGAHPLDESVFGVRDLAGSVREHTSGQPQPPSPFCSIRGGSWLTFDRYPFRAANRDGRLPHERSIENGIRLVVEIR